MKKLNLRLIDADLVEQDPEAEEGSTPVLKPDGTYAWERILPTEGIDQPKVLTATAGGDVRWYGAVVVVIPAGGSIPGDCPVGAVIVELDE